MENRIPKIIHYCWFGGNPKPQLVLKCIESWKKFCPDYEIIEWNEDSFDIHSTVFTEEAYQAKKWAFVSDYVRALALLQNGGIYLDTDIELLQSLDCVLSNSAFVGFEVNDTLGSAILGCERNNSVIQSIFYYYQDKHFIRNGNPGITTSPVVLTEILKEKGLKLNGKKQCVSDCMIYPKAAFYPTNIGWVFERYGSKTIAVHHNMDSWGKNPSLGNRSRFSKLRLSLLYHARNVFGTETIFKLGQRIRKTKQGK